MMNRRACAAFLCGAVLGPDAYAQSNAFVWRAPDIDAQVVRDDRILMLGQFLRLRQSLRPGESGWTEMKVDLPEHWKVLRAASEGDSVLVVIEAGPTTFRLNRQNIGALTFRILDGGKRWSDVQLEQIWSEIALAKGSR
jgi:hypothetical protein